MMKIYYAHAICLYGTKHEKNEMKQIKKKFPTSRIIDPGSHENTFEKSIRGMEFCLELVENSDLLIFTKLLGNITAGVGKEINHALKKGISVMELKNGKFSKITELVKYLSREETILLYGKIVSLSNWFVLTYFLQKIVKRYRYFGFHFLV